ncbi:MAG: ISL3 family transposase, partial [Ktedonobacteraceae bacterium]|nr:ISL3 family transposase [Ktedonobacteraceae bacterium]
MGLETIELHDQTVLVHLHAISSTALCPRCGTPGSRVHSRYQRTIADVAFGGRCLVLKLHVRKWICREASCSQRIFAERFPKLVQRYARMTDRLVEALQAVGVTTNGADAARIVSSFGTPTTAKTIIRRVLQLPLPSEGSVRKVGIDEWAWKKGQRFGTILVDLEKRRVAQLLSDRSVETSKAWLRTHPEIEMVSRDRGKLFREAATDGAPQAQQVVDRFHLQKNFAEALEKFFRHKTRMLKAGARSLAGKARPAARTATPKIGEQERRARHRQRVAIHKRVWKLYREGYHKEQIAQLIGISSSSVYRALEQEAAPPPRRRSRSHSIIDPYLSYLSERWNQGCHRARQLYEEIMAQGYTGSRRTLEMRLRAFRPQGAHPVSKHTITWEKPPSARGTALMIVRPVQNRTPEQTAFLEHLTQSNETVAKAYTLAQDFGRLLRQREGQLRLEQWKTAVWESGIAELIAFADGLADDAEAVVNGCSMTWSNGMVEGFVNKVKWIKRSSYGQAGFALLQRRVLLHPAAGDALHKEQRRRASHT